MASKASSISSELKRSVPLNSRCSRKCEIPACCSSSSREPTRTQNPSATERTEGMASVTTRTPESRVVIRCGSVKALVSVSAPTAVAAIAPTASPAVPAPAPPAPPAAPPPPPAAAAAPASATAPATAGADLGQLLDGLAGHIGILGQAQSDPASLAVDLDHLDLDLVAPAEHVLDGVHPLAGLHVRDVQQAVGALGQLDEGAEGGGLDHLAVELVSDLDLLGHRPNPVDQSVALLAGLRVDADGAVVVDVNLRVELLGQPADRLAALADDRADLLGVDLDRHDPRRMR